jgi:hypothetical protein
MGQPYERASQNLSKRKIIFNNFLGGIFWSLGATVGLAIIFAFLTLLANNIDIVPFVGNFVSDIIDFVVSRNPNIK